MQLLSWDYALGRPSPGIGLSRTAALIRQQRREDPDSLLFDNGDFLQGNPLADEAADRMRRDPTAAHPMIEAMNTLGYDAAALGNHEFNYGLDVLSRALEGARFPVLSANVARRLGSRPETDELYVPAWALVERDLEGSDGRRHRIKVGVLGISPPQITVWDRHHLAGRIVTRDAIEAARAHVPRLRAAGADVVVALCHSGIGPERITAESENLVIPICALDGIDAVVAGHVHQVFPGPPQPVQGDVDAAAGTIHGKPVVMAGAYGSHLGRIDIDLERDDRGWRPVGSRVDALPVARATAGRLRPVPLVRPDPELAAFSAPHHKRALDRLRKVVGQTDILLQTYFALITPNPVLGLLGAALRHAARPVAERLGLGHIPILAAVAPYRWGGRGGPSAYVDIPAGPLLRRHLAEIYLYPNTLCLIELDGTGIGRWLDRSASLYMPVQSGRCDQPLLDPRFPGYQCDVMVGLDYQIDPALPPATDPDGQLLHAGPSRISDMSIDGRPLGPDDRVIVATNSHRASGGGGYPMAAEAALIHAGDLSLQSLLRDYVGERDARQPAPLPGWRFRPRPGTGAWFVSGAGGLGHLGRAGASGIVDGGPAAEDGFHRYIRQF